MHDVSAKHVKVVKSGAGKEKRVAVNMPDEMYTLVEKRAKEQDRSVAGYLRHLVKKDTTGVEQKPEPQAA